MIDCHIHRYPPEVFKDPSEWALRMGEAHWIRLVAPSKGASLQGWADRRRLIEDMDRAGIEKVIMLGWYWESQATCELQNRWHLDWIKEDPDRLLAFAAVQPGEGDHAFDAIRRAIEKVESLLLEGHLDTCVVEGIKAGRDKEVLGELMELYSLANK